MGDRMRVRFAPSPTGQPHIGNIRTALLVTFPIRAALTGSLKGPHLATVVALLGQERCLFRVQRALDYNHELVRRTRR